MDVKNIMIWWIGASVFGAACVTMSLAMLVSDAIKGASIKQWVKGLLISAAIVVVPWIIGKNVLKLLD